MIVDEAITTKLASKTTGLTEEEKGSLFLTITLWPDADVQKYLEDYSRSFSLINLNVLPPVQLTQYDNNGTKSFGFGFVNNATLGGSKD